MTPEQFDALKDWIEAAIRSAVSDPDGQHNGNLHRAHEDRARELLTGEK